MTNSNIKKHIWIYNNYNNLYDMYQIYLSRSSKFNKFLTEDEFYNFVYYNTKYIIFDPI